jgi:DNA-binding transcriptional LysR family regulator
MVAELEGRLGVRLFNRTTRSVSPTAAGEQFVAEVAPALGAIRDAMDQVNIHRATPAGLLRLNTSAGAARQMLAPVVFEYLRRYPQMSVEIVTEDRLIDIVSDGFDAGVRLQENVPKDMIAVPFGGEQRMIAVAAPSYFERHRTPDTPRDLADHDCIRMRMPGGGNVYHWEFEREGERLELNVSGRLTLDEETLIREAALAGLGLAFVSQWWMKDDLPAGRLVQVLSDWTPPYPGLALYYPGRRHVPAGLRALIDLLRNP